MKHWLKLWQILRENNLARVLAAAAVLGLLLLVWGRARASAPASSGGAPEVSLRFYTELLEERVAALCREVGGVREAHVLLTLEGGVEYVYAEAARSAETPLLLQQISPQIRGVAVVCTHGGDSAVQRTITELLSAALGVPASRIRVAGNVRPTE